MSFNVCIVLLPVLAILSMANAQQPEHCCLPPLFTLGRSLATYGTIYPVGMFQESIFYFDYPNTRFAIKTTIKELYTKQPVESTYQILDYKKKMQYMIDNNTDCYKSPLEGNFPPAWCIPKIFKYTGSTNLGDTYIVNRWYYQDNQSTISTTTTPKTCVPVTLLETSAPDMEDSEMNSGEFYDFKPNIDQPDQKFKPPAFCKIPVAKRKRDINHMLKSPFDILSTHGYY